jgi:hypothetical protein
VGFNIIKFGVGASVPFDGAEGPGPCIKTIFKLMIMNVGMPKSIAI